MAFLPDDLDKLAPETMGSVEAGSGMMDPAPQTAVQLVKHGELKPFASIAQNGNGNEHRVLEDCSVP